MDCALWAALCGLFALCCQKFIIMDIFMKKMLKNYGILAAIFCVYGSAMGMCNEQLFSSYAETRSQKTASCKEGDIFKIVNSLCDFLKEDRAVITYLLTVMREHLQIVKGQVYPLLDAEILNLQNEQRYLSEMLDYRETEAAQQGKMIACLQIENRDLKAVLDKSIAQQKAMQRQLGGLKVGFKKLTKRQNSPKRKSGGQKEYHKKH